MREEFFSKFIDYNNQLEKILETKDFSKEAKNLLLSMFYKIDISYSDYQTVKRKVKNKQAFLEDILRMVDNCEGMELVKPNSEIGKTFQERGIKYEVNPLSYEIVAFENEKVILEALFQLDNTNFYLPEKYNLIRIALPEVLNEGMVMNKVEVIRDFNAWSWNVLPEELGDFYANIIYQNLSFLIGQEDFEDWLTTDEIENKMEWLKSKLLAEEKEEEMLTFLTCIYQIAIDCTVNKNKIEKARLWDEKQALQEEYEKRSNKEQYLEEMTENKKEAHKEIETIDRILNDKLLLEKEYKARNAKLKEYNKILNTEHLIEILNKQRRKLIREIEGYNHLLQPKEYLAALDKTKRDLELLEDIEKKGANIRNIEEKVIQLEKLFFCFFQKKIKQIVKKEQLELVYMLRYYEQVPFNKKKRLGQIKELRDIFENLEEEILNQLLMSKGVNKVAEDNSFNIKILKHIFHTKIIDLENMYIKMKQKDSIWQLEIYDKEVLEKEITLEEIGKEVKAFKIKKNKMIKVFA